MAVNFLLKCFASSKTCLTFVLAFGKQRGYRGDDWTSTIDP